MEEIDKLTRKLMESTAERPSSRLNECIMRLIWKEKSLRKRIVYVESLPRIGAIAWGVVFYLLLVLFLFFYFRGESVTLEGLWALLRPYAPLVILVSGAIPLYLMGVWIDKKRMNR